jgi:hypothetical protein
VRRIQVLRKRKGQLELVAVGGGVEGVVDGKAKAAMLVHLW